MAPSLLIPLTIQVVSQRSCSHDFQFLAITNQRNYNSWGVAQSLQVRCPHQSVSAQLNAPCSCDSWIWSKLTAPWLPEMTPTVPLVAVHGCLTLYSSPLNHLVTPSFKHPACGESSSLAMRLFFLPMLIADFQSVMICSH